MRKTLLFASVCAIYTSLSAAVPTGYYDDCEGLYGRYLLEALEDAIGSHTAVGYNGLWSLYETSDVYPDGKIWDIYSTKHWKPGNDQCGTYSQVGDCYNREHSFPKSWFGGAQPMYCDAFHIYPTDGKVNGQRSNYPYGECANGTTLNAPSGIRALGKLGQCTFSGYSGVVFEPDDEYKGDVARSYFYMAACYNSLIDDWNSDMLAGNSYPAFASWAVNLLLKWHRQDPVSEKEQNRNEAIYTAQHNRNPFIDHPELAEYIWGSHKTEPWSPNGQAEPQIVQPVDGTVYDFGVVPVGDEFSVSIPVKGTHLSAPVSISTSSWEIGYDRASLTAAQAMSGSSVLVTWNPEEAGQLNATVSFTSGDASSSVIIRGTAVEGLVANKAQNITETSFTASWNYVGDADADGNYTVVVERRSGVSTQSNAAGERLVVKAPANAGSYDIDGLMPESEYAYWVQSETYVSNTVVFYTSMSVPYIDLWHEGPLNIEARPNEPSGAYEIMVNAENITTDIRIDVNAPFQLSTNKADWGQSITIDAEEDRFYLRLYGEEEGTYSSPITLTAGTYVNDQTEVEGVISVNAQGITDPAHGWDAYCLDGKLVVELDIAQMVAIYGVDGLTYCHQTLEGGTHTFTLAPRLYIVIVDGYSRRAIVKN